ncbi:MAG: hypothetical protein FJ109_13790 [Deltaproteobacteria bacterium]|nr:hypothetical protein [Deltaproteobacteria bacterium]
MPRLRRFDLVVVLPLLLLALLLPSCGLIPLGDPGGGPCPCKEGLLCVNSVCRADCRSSDCPGDTQCNSVEGADLAVCLPPGESLGILLDGPKLPVPLDLLWTIENGVHSWKTKNELADRFPELVAALGGDAQVAIRTAVISSLRNGFLAAPARDWPPSCSETWTRKCLADKDCETQLGNPGWKCNAKPANQMYNLNGSVNSSCTFRCGGDSDCCGEFCFGDQCGDDQSCVDEQCEEATGAPCSHVCKQPGGDADWSVCTRGPASADCPSDVPSILEGKSLELFRCLAVLEVDTGLLVAYVDRYLSHLWASLDPDGPNAEAASKLLRPEADLSVVFVGDEEDCSTDPGYASPSFTCQEDKDCPGSEDGLSVCKTDLHFSQMSGKQIKLCHGAIKKDYYGMCGLLGEFQGLEHHNCAYDLGCKDCETDDDCPQWWACSDKGKCRPSLYGLPNIATFQNPPGTPVFSLAAVAPFREKLLSLKKNPLQVSVAAIVGDGLTLPPDENDTELPSLISQACLEDEKVLACQAYLEDRKKADPKCVSDPMLPDCEDYRAAKLACIRECYVASLGNPKSPTMSGNTYVSYTDDFGRAWLPLRLIRFAETFGSAGAVYNFNAPGGVRAALLDLADRLNKRIYRACLPEGYTEGTTVLLLRHAPLEAKSADRKADDGPPHDWTDPTPEPVITAPGELLTQGPDGDFEILPSWYACCPVGQPDCPNPGPAIQFHAMVKAGTTFEVVFVAQQDSAN